MELYKKHISDLGRIVTGKTPRTSIPENYGGIIPFITPSDDLSGKYVYKTSKTLSELGLNEVKNCLLPSNSICVSCIGSDLGKVIITNKPTVTNQQFNSIIPNEENNADFVYYLMSVVGKHLNFLSKTSTAVPIINKSSFSDFEIEIPSLDDQIRIATVLSSLDDKIECNRQINDNFTLSFLLLTCFVLWLLKLRNDNLEQQAQALFKSWFVDFEPFMDGEFVESEMGMIPKGWRVRELDEIIEISKQSINPNKSPEILFAHYSIPAYDREKQPDTQLGKEILSNKFVVRDNMILFSKLNPRIKRIWYVGDILENSICSTEFVPFLAKDCALSVFVFSLVSSQGFYDYILSMVNGATGSHQRFHPEETLSYKIAYNQEIALEYNAIAEPMITQILKNQQESRRLAQLRDTLLPRLMSGKLKVSEL